MQYQYKNNFIGYFKFYYRIVGKRMIFFFMLTILISFLDGLGLAMFIPLLQSVSDAGNTGAADTSSMGELHYLVDFIRSMGFELTLNTVLGSLMILFIAKGIMRFFQLSYYAALRQYFIKKVRTQLIDNLNGISYNLFLKIESGRIQNTLTVDVQRLFQTMKFYFDASQAFVMLATYMLLAFLANYQFAILVGVGAGLSNLIYRRIYKVTKKASIALSSKGSDFNSFLGQSTNYFKYLKSTNTFAPYAKKLKKVITETEFLNRKIGNMNAITTAVKEPMIVTIVTIVIFVQIRFMGASLGAIILSLLLFYRALSFLVMIQNHWQGYIENIGGMNAVATLLDEMASLKEENGQTQFTNLEKGITVSNVTFKYGDKTVIDNISIQIPRRKTVALVGESGSGKTTMANMIVGLIKPESGTIYIDGIAMDQYDLNSYRSTIGYISQESVIFSDSIYNNITFWAEKTPENIERFKEVVKIALLEDFINNQPEHEETKLGDNGILISGGQRQRISIARELYKNTSIIVFDEATSALDSETEKSIQENIEKLYGSFTMILIAHRLSTIKTADTIFLLEKGKISASGTFEEMIDKSPRFKKMVSLQGFH